MIGTEELKRRISFRDLLRKLYPEQHRDKGNVCCPFHDDVNPSMQVNADSGFCHSCGKNFDIFDLWISSNGGTFQEATLALNQLLGGNGNRPQIKTRKQREPQQERIKEAEYIYVDELGRPLYKAIRWRPKKFQQSAYINGQWQTYPGCMDGIRQVLYRLPEVIEADHVFLVGGEKDAETLRQHGLTATTNASGEGNFKGQCDKHGIHIPLTGKRVTFLPDCDKAGREWAKDVEHILRSIKCKYRRVDLPGMPDSGYDSTDFIEQRGFEAFQVLVHDAWQKSLTGLEVESLVSLYNREIPEPKWIVEGVLPEGLCLFAGDPKLGKSWAAFHLMLSVSGGQEFMKYWPSNPGRSVYFALEDNDRRAKLRLLKLLKEHNQDCLRDAEIAYRSMTLSHDNNKPGLIDQLWEWYEPRKAQARLVILDTLEKVRPHGKKRKSDNVYAQDYEDLGALQQFALECNLAVVVVHHHNKSSDADPLKRISGSSGVSGSADTIWTLSRQRSSNIGKFGVTGRDVTEKTYVIEKDPESQVWVYKGEQTEISAGTLKSNIYELLMDAPGHTLTPAALAKQTGKSVDQISVVLGRMQHDHSCRVEKVGWGKWKAIEMRL